MKKKLISLFSILMVSTLSFSLVGCGDTEPANDTSDTTTTTTQPVQENETEDNADVEDNAEVDKDVDANIEEEVPEDDAVQDLANALDGTMWVGTDADSTIYAVSFDGTAISMEYVASDGSDNQIDGYWAIDETTLYIYIDEDMTEEGTSFSWSFEDYDGTNLIYLDDACLTQTTADEAGDLATAISQMNVVNDVISYVADGTYWVGSDETTVGFFAFDGADIYMYMVDMATGEEMAFQGAWGLDYDTFYMVDTESGQYISYNWNIATDGSTFSLVDENGETMEFSQTDATDVDSAMAILDEYLGGEEE